MKRKFGIFMDGCEKQFEQYIRESYAARNGRFVYVEVGIGYAETLLAVSQILKEIGPEHFAWTAVGVDVKDDHISEDAIRPRFGNIPITFPRDGFGPMVGITNVSTEGSPDFFTSRPFLEIDFLFLDGCHGQPCVERDFRAIDPHMKPGSFLLFHDASDFIQGGHPQAHCSPRGIEVQAGIKALGLWEGNERWERLPDIPGISGCAVFKRK